MITSIENELPDVHAQVGLLCRGNVDEPIFIAGWSHARGRPEAYIIRTAEDISSTTMEEPLEEAILPPVYKLQPLGGITFSPFVTREAYEQAGICGACEMDEATLFRHMTALLELQRRNFFRSPKGEPFCGIASEYSGPKGVVITS